MKLRIAAACAALSFACAAPAFAGLPVTATLAAPVDRETRPIAGDVVWRCAADSCATQQAIRATVSVNTCKAIARSVGPVTAFQGGGITLSADELTRCNAVARTVQASTAAPTTQAAR